MSSPIHDFRFRFRNKRILFMNRPDWEQNPGGDTIVIKEYMRLLKESDNVVEFSCNQNHDMSGFDIIHLINCTLTGYTDGFARSAVLQNKPFVITALQEDFPLFMAKSDFTADYLINYVSNGQPKDMLCRFSDAIQSVLPAFPALSPYASLTTSKLLACGENEAATIRKSFPASPISIIPFGSTRLKSEEIRPELFTDTFGVKDFILCVGRIEPRKNQLMLLTAFEKESIPIVFVDGDTTYKPSYKNACRKFTRSGTTIFTGRISDEMLIAAYKAARLHCLPSFYELPGLVSLEAAKNGCQVVGSAWGTLPDYLSDLCFYCEPDIPDNIYKVVLEAFETPANPALAQTAESFSWERSVDELTYVYNEILSNPVKHAPTISADQLIFDPLSLVEIVTGYIETGKYEIAISLYRKHRNQYPNDSRLKKIDSIMQHLSKLISKDIN